MIAQRTRGFAKFVRVLFEKEIGAELGRAVLRESGKDGFLRETVGGVPLGGGPCGIAAEEAQRGVNGVGGNGGDRSGLGEEENFFGGGIADGRKFFQSLLGFGQGTLQDGAHVAGKFVEDARGDFLQAKCGELGLHDAGAHDFAKFCVGGVEDFLRGEADFFFERAKTLLAALVGLRIAAVAMEQHFVRIGGIGRLGFAIEFFEAIENHREADGVRCAFEHSGSDGIVTSGAEVH